MSELHKRCETLRERTAKYGQEHTLAFWDGLSSAGRERLLSALEGVDFALLQSLISRFLPDAAPSRREGKALAATPAFTPPTAEELRAFEPEEILPSRYAPGKEAEAAAAREVGEEALRAGRVAAFVVAGGQGSRLGFDGPKGAFEIGPVTRRTLFQVHAEKILALRRRYGCPLPWLIMTSESNDAATRTFLEKHEWFGLGQDSVRLFRQESLPAVGRDGRILLDAPDHPVLSPNGHGGSLKALLDSGSLAWARERGTDTISYFQVDNPLVRIGDPVFIGRHLQAAAEMSSKVIEKRDWREKLGVVGRLNGRATVVEYSDLPEESARAEEKTAAGKTRLRFWAGSIAVHLLDAGFIERLGKGGFQLPYHKAEKAVPGIDKDGRPVRPAPGEKNGLKFEMFVFDALPLARRTMTMETERDEDFAPVKNATGEDSPETARRMLTALYAGWLRRAGQEIPPFPNGASSFRLEISPLSSLEGENLAEADISRLKSTGKLLL